MKTKPYFLRVTIAVCLLLSFVVLPISAQEKAKDKKDKTAATPTPVPTPTPAPATDYNALMSNLRFREIGPATMGGRAQDCRRVGTGCVQRRVPGGH